MIESRHARAYEPHLSTGRRSLALTRGQAFEALFCASSTPPARVLAAMQVLLRLRPDEFIAVALDRLRAERGSPESLVLDRLGMPVRERLVAGARVIELYWLDAERTQGLTTGGRLVYRYPGGRHRDGSRRRASQGYVRWELEAKIATLITWQAQGLLPPSASATDGPMTSRAVRIHEALASADDDA
ncbi:MAG: hypothetical protein ABSH51_03225 [Solirubrobacteraceae bacterium]